MKIKDSVRKSKELTKEKIENEIKWNKMLGKDKRGITMKEKRKKGVKYSRNKIEIK